MIFELLLKPLFALVGLLIDILPNLSQNINFSAVSGLIDFLAFGFWVFPIDLFLIFIANIIFWLGIQNIWAKAEFVIKKLPFINLK